MKDERKAPCIINIGGVRFPRGAPMHLIYACIENHFTMKTEKYSYDAVDPRTPPRGERAMLGK